MLIVPIDRLKAGQIEKIDLTMSSDFLDIHEPFLDFSEPVIVQGKAYLADDHVVLSLVIRTQATIPCRICNGPLKTPIFIEHFTHAESLSTLKTPLFDYSPQIREAILLQAPAYVECPECPEREIVDKFLKKSPLPPSQQTHYPFADSL